MTLFEPPGTPPARPPATLTPPSAARPAAGYEGTPFPASPVRPQPSRAARRVSRIASVVSIVLALAFAASLFADDLPMPVRSWIADTVPGGRSLVGLPPEPAAEVAALAARMGLTAEGELLFASARPRVVDDLSEICGEPDDAGDAVTLGCYHGLGRIYILRAPGVGGEAIMRITAAHELLHAAYARLSDAERAAVDRLVAVETARLDADAPVLAQIDASVGSDEANRANEQFAYLGSQTVLPGGFAPELEEIYARWFTDRAALAASAP